MLESLVFLSSETAPSPLLYCRAASVSYNLSVNRSTNSISALPARYSSSFKNRIQIINVSVDSLDDDFPQRTPHPRNRLLTRPPMHNQLRQHRIIKRRNHIPVIRRRIHPYSKSPRQMHLRNLPRTRPEILRRILRINPALNRMPRKPDLPLRHRQRHPRSHPKLFLNQIHPP